jgi:hypothetical protein
MEGGAEEWMYGSQAVAWLCGLGEGAVSLLLHSVM